MKIEVDVKKKYILPVLAVMILFGGIFAVIAFNTNNPQSFGHSTGEMDWSQPIEQHVRIKGNDLVFTSDSDAEQLRLKAVQSGGQNNVVFETPIVSTIAFETGPGNSKLTIRNTGVQISDLDVLGNLDTGGSINGRNAPLKVEVRNPSNANHVCETVNVQNHCGDEDGCKVQILLQNQNGNDNVALNEFSIYMESDESSMDLRDAKTGYTRGHDGEGGIWVTGSGIHQNIHIANNGQSRVHNYLRADCNGGVNSPIHTNAYLYTFWIHQNNEANIYIYD